MRGLPPMVTDGPGLWTQERRRANQPDTLVLLGLSRIQYGFDLTRARERLTDLDPVMLAITGSSVRPVLRDLAEDKDFRGVVLFSSWPDMMAPSPWEDLAEEWVRYAHHETWDQALNQRARTFAQSHFVLSGYLTSPRHLWVNAVGRGRLPGLPYISTSPERGGRLDSTLLTNLETIRFKIADDLLATPWPWSPETWLAATEDLQGWADAIEARGGRVLFARLPTAGRMRAVEADRFPRPDYWDRFAAEVSQPTWHFEDQAQTWVIPDGSHVEGEGRMRLTDALVEFVERHRSAK
ncbi:MAG: hypothetical protein AAGA48_14545 [Myxococcota bacterium]